MLEGMIGLIMCEVAWNNIMLLIYQLQKPHEVRCFARFQGSDPQKVSNHKEIEANVVSNKQEFQDKGIHDPAETATNFSIELPRPVN